MKVIPAPGYALLQIVKEDLRRVSETKTILVEGKDIGFFNRMKVIELGSPKASTPIRTQIKLQKGDIVVISSVGAQVGVLGVITNDQGGLIDVMLVAQELIIAKIEGDIAEDIEAAPVIVNPHIN